MAIQDNHLLHLLYSGEPAEKLATAHRLHAELHDQLAQIPGLAQALAEVQHQAQLLSDHMQSMGLGQMCSRCAANPGGGCCSATMAGNTDVIQILLNLLLGVTVELRADSGENCGFLGPRGCLFPLKPIFCLNYNCNHILNDTDPDALALLYQRANAVLSRQTAIEAMLLAKLRPLISVMHTEKPDKTGHHSP
jgi:hypothetical protein